MNSKEILYFNYRNGKLSKDDLLTSLAEIDRPNPSFIKKASFFVLALIFPFFMHGSK